MAMFGCTYILPYSVVLRVVCERQQQHREKSYLMKSAGPTQRYAAIRRCVNNAQTAVKSSHIDLEAVKCVGRADSDSDAPARQLLTLRNNYTPLQVVWFVAVCP